MSRNEWQLSPHIWRSITRKRAPFSFFVAVLTSGGGDFRDVNFNSKPRKASRSWFENWPGTFFEVWFGSPGICWGDEEVLGKIQEVLGKILLGSILDFVSRGRHLLCNRFPKKSLCTLKTLGKRVNIFFERTSHLGNLWS